MGYILHKGTTRRLGGEAYEAAGRGIKSTLLRAVGPGAEWYGVSCDDGGRLPRRDFGPFSQ